MAAREQDPSLPEYLNASNEAYTQPGISTAVEPDYPAGLTPLETTINGQLAPVYSYDAADGFYAIAFKTPENKVLIAFEGTNLFTGDAQFTAAQVADDADIVAGTLSPAFTDARQFTKTALADAKADHIKPRNVYLTGHSLGAAEAEYVAAKTGMAGTTFGTPGISTKFFTRPYSRLTNYVEIGDPVGNFANENTGSFFFPSPIAHIVKSISPTNQHYGTTHYIGYDDPTSLAAYASLRAADGFYQGGTDVDTAAAVAALAAAVPDHYLAQYGHDLGVPLASHDSSTGASALPLGSARATSVASTRSAAAEPMCFVAGTRIATPCGEVRVEALAVGDLVATASGAHRAIRWLGHRTIASPTGSISWNSRPIRVLAGAFGLDLPVRDLLLSPGHPVLVGADADGAGGLLVPIMCLENGTTIARLAVARVTYWHVELEAHDILLAEGLPAESYLECGDRAFFDGLDHPLADPDLVVPGLGGRCRPVAIDGPVVEAERRRLDGVLVMRLAAACAWPEAIASA